MATTRLAALIAAGLGSIALAGCGGDDEAAPSTAVQATTTPVGAPATIEGRFDVGDHSLYLRCTGSGSPTVVYLHGYIVTQGGAEGAGRVPSLLEDRHRICVYDRPNLGRSDTVQGLVTGMENVRDLERLLRVAEVEPPYVLLGASFGGLLAYVYAATHPEQVKGMVLLDAAFPGELALERFFPEEERFVNLDWLAEGAEHLDQYDVYRLANRLPPPKVPATYLLAQPSGWTGSPAYEAVVLDRIADYVAGFSPGILEKVESPHYMEEAIPERVAQEIDALIARLPAGG